MALQPFEAAAGIQITGGGLVISSTGVPGSGTNDSTAQTAAVGTIYIRIGAGNAEFYQKNTGGATTGDWSKLAVDGDVSDIYTLIGVTQGDTDMGAFTGDILTDNSSVKTLLQELETYAEATRSLVNNFEWQESALDYVVDNTAVPASETTGDRYILSHDGGVPHANYDGASAGSIVEFDGSVWIETVPTTGTYIAADDETNGLYLWGGASWSFQNYENTTASTGLTKVGNDIRLDASSAGAGIGFTAGVLNVNVDDSTIEVSTDTLQVKADGINDTHIDFGTGANQVSAVDIPLLDAGGYFTTDTVEDALQQLGDAVDLQTSLLAQTGGSTVTAFSVLVDEVQSMTVEVTVQDTTTSDTETVVVHCLHDGDGATDAAGVNHDEFSKVKVGNVAGLSVNVDLNGTGASQEMRVRVTATNAFDVRSVAQSLVKL